MSDETVFEMQPVASSQIAAVGYNEQTKQLRVEFSKGGAVYEYDAVEPGTFSALLNAASVGSFFAGAIKGAYPYRRIS